MRGFFLTFLVLAFEPLDAFCPGRPVFGGSALDPPAPHVKGASSHVFAHDCPHLIFFDAVLHLDGLEGRAVFPGHLHNAVHGFCIQITWRFILQVFGIKGEHVLKTAQHRRCFEPVGFYRFRKTVIVSQTSPEISKQKPVFERNTAPIR